MNIETCKRHCEEFAKLVEQKYTQEGTKRLFDEFVLVRIAGIGKVSVILYLGDRTTQEIETTFNQDSTHLWEELRDKNNHLPGSFYFEQNATDTFYDAFLFVGNGVFFLLNNLSLSMNQIREQFPWKKAQWDFASFAALFSYDPVE